LGGENFLCVSPACHFPFPKHGESVFFLIRLLVERSGTRFGGGRKGTFQALQAGSSEGPPVAVSIQSFFSSLDEQ